MWHHLLVTLRRWVPGWAGVRVFEMHNGKLQFRIDGVTIGESHGLHVHFLATRFHWVRDVHALAKAIGWGRVHVTRVKQQDKEKVAAYLGKYLSKARPDELKGVRLVGYVGMGATRTRYKDIEFYGFTQDLWRAATQFPTWHSMNFYTRCEFVHLLKCRCVAEDTAPMVEVLDLIHGDPDRYRAELMVRKAKDKPVSGDKLFELRQTGVLRHAEAVHGNRFAPKSLKLRIPPVEAFADS